MAAVETFDTVVVGGGPAGATAATDLARRGRSVLLLDKAGRIKPCGGAIPPVAIRQFEIPDHMLVAKITGARMIAPSARQVDMPIDGGFVGMVDRGPFDEWLRERAEAAGATRRAGTFERLGRDDSGLSLVHYRPRDAAAGTSVSVRARTVIGADGAISQVGRQAVPGADQVPHVFAYHEIVESPASGVADFDPARCDVYYQGPLSPDFYAWIFPHGATTSIGTGSMRKGFALREAVAQLRRTTGLDACATIRHEGAPIPLHPLKRWDNGRDVLLAGDAAGVVAPASGEGIFYALTGGRLAAEAVDEALATGDARALALARKRFMKAHGRVFFILGLLQRFWYRSDWTRERFVGMCRDPDVQRLTWQAYMNKELVRAKPAAHVRIFFKDIASLCGLAHP
ncbi:geranylgeranyl diphosphate reductase [Rhodoplanes sp. TEM]|uniref:geranylgeranyl diphosphate reductase n=1 Tax=Rhodoplanes tepidamans TaxID=200616 RepID=A0ABT5J4N7_RHOTP|nr:MULTISPECIES: geranylgeranyl diphosphate reductase [Rhodoplanes]MDC7784599.1 geranylgeranyl diphosphate reductase [Rhodoplanes tepidamans]MDC7982891.1 geranylgeranyl diphosphate reductase [Rhodoplanes sp. TEM]MDQ0355827.1 geranylgeranyl reductase [Rhodoplanes tepidamans]